MSIVAFKKKGVIQFGSNVSGKYPGGVWLNQGPFGSKNGIGLSAGSGPGFSINGGIRTGRYIGQGMSMSKSGTPFRGVHAKGFGGILGRYPRVEPTMNACSAYVDITGNQSKFIKQSSLSTKGMLERKYKWVHNGQYPNNWVQPDDNIPDNFSQWLYIQNKAATNDCTINTNDTAKYVGNIKRCTNSATPLSRTTYNNLASNGAYTKELYIPQTASQYTLRIQRKCTNPLGPQKPFPFAANNNYRGSSGSTNYISPAISVPIFLTPPNNL